MQDCALFERSEYLWNILKRYPQKFYCVFSDRNSRTTTWFFCVLRKERRQLEPQLDFWGKFACAFIAQVRFFSTFGIAMRSIHVFLYHGQSLSTDYATLVSALPILLYLRIPFPFSVKISAFGSRDALHIRIRCSGRESIRRNFYHRNCIVSHRFHTELSLRWMEMDVSWIKKISSGSPVSCSHTTGPRTRTGPRDLRTKDPF